MDRAASSTEMGNGKAGMAPPLWTVRHKPDVAPLAVSFPANTAPNELPPYVLLAAGGERAYCRTSTRRGAAGHELWIYPRTLAGVDDGTSATFVSARVGQYRWHRLWHGPSQWFARASLVVALAGVVPDAAVAIGKVYPLWIVSNEVIAATLVAGFVLKAVGFALVFFKGVWEADT